MRPLHRPWSSGGVGRGTSRGWRSRLWAVARRGAKLLRRIFIPSVLGICLGGGVGLFAKTLMLPPETAPLGWLFISASKLGEAAVPPPPALL